MTEEAARDRFAEFADVRGRKYLVIVWLRDSAREEFAPLLFDTGTARFRGDARRGQQGGSAESAPSTVSVGNAWDQPLSR
ncbi:hypothetical protein OG920_43505 [Streptomyces europaeiscabiei]|uniref:hypothetical protein n=1 Tax=Streptomyces europaeiscabiei TaxID=146819 RepID=UPI0029BD61E8|nr:hypothetical protein [Streptomyces europaeiscabiei]MDX3612550.1 hypothetical protein [Streptomyces europaeiscabiei]WUD37738.1 hypothetical protein OG858_44240 [Streptomyces europaeiscabiei]